MTDPVQRFQNWALGTIAVGVLLMITIEVIAAVLPYLDTPAWEDPPLGRAPAGSWTLPDQIHLHSSMQRRPIPGWRLSVTDLGMPEDAVLSDRPGRGLSRTRIGSVDHRAFFMASSPSPDGWVWWLVAVDVAAGRPLFPALSLGPVDRPECYLNGPDSVLCVSGEVDDRTAWTVDSHSGTVTYQGPTALNVQPDDLDVHQVGIYAIATTADLGVFGVGPRAQTTWFVPGSGFVTNAYRFSQEVTVPRRRHSGRQRSLGRATINVCTLSTMQQSIPRNVRCSLPTATATDVRANVRQTNA